MEKNPLTLNDLIARLRTIRDVSPLSGSTPVRIRIPDHGGQPVHDVKLTNPDNRKAAVVLMSDTLTAIVEDLDMESLLDEDDDDPALHGMIAEGLDPASESYIKVTLEEIAGLPKAAGEDDVRVVLTVYPTGKRYLFNGETGKPSPDEEHGGFTFQRDRQGFVEGLQDDIDHNLGDWLEDLHRYQNLFPFIGVKRSIEVGK